MPDSYKDTARTFDAGGGLIGAYGALWAGKKEEEGYYRQASLLNSQADELEKRLAINIQVQKRQGIKLRGMQRVAMAGAGISTDRDTSAYDLMEESQYDLIQDIYRQMRETKYESYMMRAQAQEQVTAGKDARTASYFKAGGSLLQGLGSMAMMGA